MYIKKVVAEAEMSSISISMLSMQVSEKMISGMCEASRDVVRRAIMECGEMYNFDGKEAIRRLGVDSMDIVNEKKMSKKVVKVKSFPLPYNGELNEECCYGLNKNQGLYTQCGKGRIEDGKFCKGCQSEADKNENEEPDCGTIQSRQAVGILEYVDPKGKSPTAYTKIMKKLKLTEEEVMEEGKKKNVEVNPIHFVVPEMKRGRPKSSVEKAPKGVKGRPKKSKKVLELNEDNEEDLFASLVAAANKDDESEESENVSVVSSEHTENVAEEAADESEKAAKVAAEKAAKVAAKEAEKAAKEAEKAAKEAEKAAKEAEKLAAKAGKDAAKEVKPKKVSKKTEKVSAVDENKKEEADTVKRFEYEGIKYLKSKKTGKVYNMDQDEIGKWNAELNKIEFDEMESEEEEEDYEE